MRRLLLPFGILLMLMVPASGTSAQARLALDLAAPLQPPWTPTASDRSLFRAVDGYDRGRGVGLAVTGGSGGPNSSSEMTAISFSKHPDLAHARNGENTWYRTRVRFPENGLYRPTGGQWNWVIAWHEEYAQSESAYSIAVGVYTDYPSGNNPYLVLRLMGGRPSMPTVYTCSMPRNSLSLGHWYDLTFHFVWSPDPAVGVGEWWVDGQQICSLHFPTLYKNPDGTITFNNFGLYNYRKHADWPSRIDFDDVVIAPTRALLEAAPRTLAPVRRIARARRTDGWRRVRPATPAWSLVP